MKIKLIVQKYSTPINTTATKWGSKETHNTSKENLLLPENLHPLLNRLLHLLASFNLRTTEDKLGDQPPLARQVPLLRDGGVDERVVVLQVCAEAEGFEGCPDCMILEYAWKEKGS